MYFTPHMARHSFATWLAGENASTQEIMEAGAWRGHKSVLRYTRIDQRRIRATINKTCKTKGTPMKTIADNSLSRMRSPITSRSN
jgi:integrase